MPGSLGLGLHPLSCLDPPIIELVRWESAYGRVHAVLGVQDLHRVPRLLQPLEQGHVIPKGHCTLGDDCRWQLDRVSHQIHLHQWSPLSSLEVHFQGSHLEFMLKECRDRLALVGRLTCNDVLCHSRIESQLHHHMTCSVADYLIKGPGACVCDMKQVN